MFRRVVSALTLIVSLVQSNCHMSDYKSVIGGESYTVDYITVKHFSESTNHFLAVAGLYSTTGK